MPFRQFEDFEKKKAKGKRKFKEPAHNGRKRELEIGDKRLYSVAEVRAQLDDLSRKPFGDFLALLLGAHPTEDAILAFAAQNPDKWAQAVNTFSKLTGYREELEITHNVYALVRTMSDMDLEHSLRDALNKAGDSYLTDPAEITTPYKRIGQNVSAAKRIIRNAK